MADKVLEQVLRGTSDASISFRDLRNLLLRLGFDERTKGGHHMFRKTGVRELINLQKEGEEREAISSSAGSSGDRSIQAR